MQRYICIHGHFYQPPRENAWLETIEVQDSAYPFHDWNERITAECYAPNSRSRVLDGENYLIQIVNNYSRISFNFGPTLLSWLEPAAPRVYQALLEADKLSQERFSGHGSALAQAYGHAIMPLCNSRDRRTQVVWGLHDFEKRFGRKAEGMWLPETAVNTETLDLLAEHGIKFTILAPRQARRTKALTGGRWEDVSGDRIDPTRAYVRKLPSGRSIALFFYDGPISQAVAFEGLLNSGEGFANRLKSGLSDQRKWPQLMHIATDGESYGHHHRFGDMALASALNRIEKDRSVQLTIYGEYLEKHPPEREVEIFENTSWSCYHGVERWKSNCGDSTGGHQGWNQEWRAPLREALDWLRDELAPLYETEAGVLLKDPWAARDDYISVILDRSQENLDRFFGEHAKKQLSDEEVVRALKLLELQRNALLMYTSCGWFFDELSGIETVQVIQYAGRVVDLAGQLGRPDAEDGFRELLAKAKSNIPEHGDGRAIYDKWVRPARVSLSDVGAHYAVSSLFEEYAEQTQVFDFDIQSRERRVWDLGRTKATVGRAVVVSRVTRESLEITYGALHMGDHNVIAGVRESQGQQAYEELLNDSAGAFEAADFADAVRVLDRHFTECQYSVRSLFKDQQRKVMNGILDTELESALGVYRAIYEREAPTIRFLVALGSPVPRAFQTAAEFFIDSSLRRALNGNGALDRERVRSLVEEARAVQAPLDAEGLGYLFGEALHKEIEAFAADSANLDRLRHLTETIDLAHRGPFQVDLWEPQNLYYEMLQAGYPDAIPPDGLSGEEREEWFDRFRELGQLLRIRTPIPS